MHTVVVPERQVVPGRERICGDEQRRAGVGARSAHLTSDSPHLFERRERSERSELCGATPDRAAQCSRRAAPTATVERTAGRRLPRPVVLDGCATQASARTKISRQSAREKKPRALARDAPSRRTSRIREIFRCRTQATTHALPPGGNRIG